MFVIPLSYVIPRIMSMENEIASTVINSSNGKSGIVITNSREVKTIPIVHTLMIVIGPVLKGSE